jgi:hypothetical protein
MQDLVLVTTAHLRSITVDLGLVCIVQCAVSIALYYTRDLNPKP